MSSTKRRQLTASSNYWMNEENRIPEMIHKPNNETRSRTEKDSRHKAQGRTGVAWHNAFHIYAYTLECAESLWILLVWTQSTFAFDLLFWDLLLFFCIYGRYHGHVERKCKIISAFIRIFFYF